MLCFSDLAVGFLILIAAAQILQLGSSCTAGKGHDICNGTKTEDVTRSAANIWICIRKNAGRFGPLSAYNQIYICL